MKLDVSVPVAALAALRRRARRLVAARPRAAGAAAAPRVVVFGHLGVQQPARQRARCRRRRRPRRTPSPTRSCATSPRRGGSISAEHGVGRAKVDWLPLTRSRHELDAMLATKRALDPTWLLGARRGSRCPRPDAAADRSVVTTPPDGDLVLRHAEPGRPRPRHRRRWTQWWGGRPMAAMLPRLFFVHFRPTSFVLEQDGRLVAFLVRLRVADRPDAGVRALRRRRPARARSGCRAAAVRPVLRRGARARAARSFAR